jgi:glyoxylase-like metal-dependent hydrolase (beta-lactamase superfamily II)
MANMNTSIHRFSIGKIDCAALGDGHFVYSTPLFPPPAQFLFVSAPSDQLGEMLQEDGIHLKTWDQWTSPYTCLLIETAKHVILVDTGAGGLGPHTGQLMESLASAGISPGDVDLVVITHAHPDHVGGNTDSQGHCRFPRAGWVISEREWDFWIKGEAERELPEHVREVMLGFASRNLSVLENQVQLITGEEELLPGVLVVPAPGHTPGQLAVKVCSEGESLYCLSDVVLHPLHVRRPEWVAAVDMLPTQLVATRKVLLQAAAEEKAIVMNFHFPFPGLGRVLPRGDGWEWKPLG